MEDQETVALYWARDERAVAETSAKYGAYCLSVARRILSDPRDAEESVNDTWAAAWGAYLLARQAGLDVEFADGERPLPEAPAYILPSLAGDASMSRHAWYELLDRVMSGATLFLP